MGMLNIQFPCGFRIEQDGLWIETKYEIKHIFENGCPIHGKECGQK